MPTAPTGMEPSKLRPDLADEEAPARRSEYRTTPDRPAPGIDGGLAPADVPADTPTSEPPGKEA